MRRLTVGARNQPSTFECNGFHRYAFFGVPIAYTIIPCIPSSLTSVFKNIQNRTGRNFRRSIHLGEIFRQQCLLDYVKEIGKIGEAPFQRRRKILHDLDFYFTDLNRWASIGVVGNVCHQLRAMSIQC